MLLVEFYYNKFARVLHLFFQGCRTVSVIFAKTGDEKGRKRNRRTAKQAQYLQIYSVMRCQNVTRSRKSFRK